MNRQKTLYYYLSKYRLELMGFAILWVVWIHSSISLEIFSSKSINMFFKFLKAIGYGGVDIFLLLSGMGIYNSLSKNKKTIYIKNRAKKILPVWYTYLLLAMLIDLLVFHIHYRKLEIIGFATFTGWWLGMKNQGNWYIYGIVLFYIVAPLIYYLFKENKNKRLVCISLVLISIFVSMGFTNTFKLLVYLRFPIFIIGMYVSAGLKHFKINKRILVISFILMMSSFVILFIFYTKLPNLLWSYGLYWYPWIIIAPCLSLLLASLMDKFCIKLKYLLLILRRLGISSLEILLVQDYIFAKLKDINFSLVNAFLIAIGAILLGLLFHIIIEYSKKTVINIYNKKYKHS